jgi:hypothetical protein
VPPSAKSGIEEVGSAHVLVPNQKVTEDNPRVALAIFAASGPDVINGAPLPAKLTDQAGGFGFPGCHSTEESILCVEAAGVAGVDLFFNVIHMLVRAYTVLCIGAREILKKLST